MVFLTSIAGTFGYAFMMSIMYLFCFTEEEMARLASYHRYMSSYVIAEVVILVYLILLRFKNSNKANNVHMLTIGFFSVGLILGSTSFSYFVPQRFNEFSDDDKKFEEYAEVLKENTEPGSNIFIVADSNNMHQFYIGYYVNDRHISMEYTNIYGFDFGNEEDKQKLMEEISDNDYIYFIDFNENISNGLADIAPNEGIEKDHVYKVNVTDNGIVLE